jgi:protein arginine phosphatase
MNRVLFVCTGNTCRSPMAEAILKSQNITGLEVKSAGVYASHGQPASRYAKEVLDDNQIPHNHASRLLSEEDLEWATHILTMTEGHKHAITQMFPNAQEKIFTIKEFVSTDEYNKDVFDPFGGSKEIYAQTFDELKDLVDKLIEKMK